MDISKHIEIFNPQNVKGDVLIIGAGAVGSALALEIAKLGVKEITIMDGDVVEAHNVSNQLLYGAADIGSYKPFVLFEKLKLLTDCFVFPDMGYFTEKSGKLRFEYIFVCVDSMAARKLIFERGVFLNATTKFLCDGRMNAKTITAIAHDPSDILQVKQYREELYSDDDVVEHKGSCGVTLSVAATAHVLSSLMTWMFIQEVQGNREIDEVMHSVSPWQHLSSRRFDRS